MPPVCTRAWARARSLRRAAQDARKSQQRFRSAAPKSIVQDECASAPSRAATPVHEGLAQSTRYTDFYAHAGMHWAVGRDTVDIVLLKQLLSRSMVYYHFLCYRAILAPALLPLSGAWR